MGSSTAEHVGAELGEIVAGTRHGRANDTEVTLFKSLGQAIEDLVAADLAHRPCAETRTRVTVEL